MSGRITKRIEPISRREFGINWLMEEYPPQIYDRNKKIVFEIAWPAGSASKGRLVFSRWRAMELPESFQPEEPVTRIEYREDIFQYEPTPEEAQVVEWYLNFADPNLFCAYGGPHMAQDELQMAEHPCLAALREALIGQGIEALTEEGGEPTPVLVMGAERRCAINVKPGAIEGYPQGLYGKNFARAKEDAVRKATRRIDPPTITNILAMAAPAGGKGEYSLEKIEQIVRTAYTGFAAARLESIRGRAEAPEVVVHTGFWGCGAFGGNRTLMTILQVLAARLSRLDRLVYYTVDKKGTEDFKQAMEILEKEIMPEIVGTEVKIRKPISIPALLEKVERLGLEWGISDGN